MKDSAAFLDLRGKRKRATILKERAAYLMNRQLREYIRPGIFIPKTYRDKIRGHLEPLLASADDSINNWTT
jgi:hypothetical protein